MARQQLRQVQSFAESTECRRVIQLRYLGESFAGPCGACDNCCEPRTLHDWTEEARQFISCVARLAQRGQRFGAAHVIDILRGARNERVLSRGHDTLSVHGIGKARSAQEWRYVGRALLHQGLIEETQDGYPVLLLNAPSRQVLREEIKVTICLPQKRARQNPAGARALPAANEDLFAALRALRKRLADEHGMPPYMVFHDAALREMIVRRPRTLEQFSEVPGVGQAKLARYGEEFIAALRGHTLSA